jgi:SAM-dependent methyltransferase
MPKHWLRTRYRLSADFNTYMKITKAHRGNYITFFDASDEEALALVNWVAYCREKGQNSRDASANDLWKGWLDETFIGFSGSNKILLHSGHRVPASYHFNNRQKPDNLGRLLKRGISLLKRGVAEPSPEELMARYRRCYPGVKMDTQEVEWGQDLIRQYLNSHEIYEILRRYAVPLDPSSLNFVFEIGAGAGMNLALLLRREGCEKTGAVICDLPQTMMAGYVFLRSALPDFQIKFPHEFDSTNPIRPSQIQFIVPDQIADLPDDSFDLGINTNSFQEMELETVNDYLAHSARLLSTGGLFISNNSRNARYIENNTLDRWDVSLFLEKILEREAIFLQANCGLDDRALHQGQGGVVTVWEK